MKHDHLWNNLPGEERARLMPHMLECQIRHIEQCKSKALRAHKSHMKELNDHIVNLQVALGKL